MKLFYFYFISFLICCTHTSFAQKQANVWYFGEFAGLDFSTRPPSPLPGSKMNMREGTASIADREGRLLLYTDGMTVWNRHHRVIGTGLHGNSTSTQSALIVPHPLDLNLFYVFTVDALYDPNQPEDEKNEGLNYTVVDLRLNGGEGGIVKLNVNLFLNSTEKLTGVQSATDCRYMWVIAHPYDSGDYHAYLVDDMGVHHEAVVSKTGRIHAGAQSFSVGQLKASPDGKRLACAVRGELAAKPYDGGWLEVFDFDSQTGKVSNPQLLAAFDPSAKPSEVVFGFYGVEFSPDNTKVYACESQRPILQFDLTDIRKSPVRIGRGGTHVLQLGPDGKIYGSATLRPNIDNSVVNQTHLDVIHEPDKAGLACSFQERGLHLGGGHTIFSLPNFIQSYFYRGSSLSGAAITAEELCWGEPTRFRGGSQGLIERWDWDFGDPASGAANAASGQSPAHTFTAPGTYTVRLLATNPCGQTDTVLQKVDVHPDPLVNLEPGFISVCYDQVPVRLEAPAHAGTAYRWSNGATAPVNLVSASGWHKVTLSNACRSRADSVLVEVVPRVQAYMPRDTVVCDGDFALLDARNPGASYRWSTGETTRTVQTARPGTYWVEVRNRCSAVVDTVRLYFIPEEAGALTYNVFTPNGDGVNDAFVNYVRQVPGYRMQVFSRWGSAVFDSTDAHRHWDGTHQGQPLAEGVYYYAIQTQDCRGRPLRLKGAVTLLR